ncbi:hypothetical protein RF11_04715 [Thelohanellus kitauei]|uniref:Uncharacterized protein n=1 Tax=Thelohanellus kitauei TaxID=669202 RepID=A0A0C2MAT0_THEKT|nr:hypothetical protein RF11_04715 [Thelohanellus kitauei]
MWKDVGNRVCQFTTLSGILKCFRNKIKDELWTETILPKQKINIFKKIKACCNSIPVSSSELIDCDNVSKQTYACFMEQLTKPMDGVYTIPEWAYISHPANQKSRAKVETEPYESISDSLEDTGLIHLQSYGGEINADDFDSSHS